MVLLKREIGGSGGIQENARWPSTQCPRFLIVLFVISMIHASIQGRMSTFEQSLNKIRFPRSIKAAANSSTNSTRVCNTPECIEVANKIKRSMNLTVNPCDDFFEYACGNWLSNNPLPSGTSTYSLSDKLVRTKERYFRNMLDRETITINGASRNLVQLPIKYYKSCKNQTAPENLGDSPLRELIRDLGGWSMVEEDGIWNEDNWDFNRAIGSIHKNYNSMEGPLFSIYIEYDKASDGRVSFSFHINPLEKEQVQNSRTAAYKQYITDIVTLLGGRINITDKVQALVDFETQLKEILPGPDETNPKNKMTLKKLQQQVPQFNWTKHLNQMLPNTVPQTELIYVPSLPYLKKAIDLVQNSSKSVLVNYLVWSMVKKNVVYLSTPYKQARLRFTGKTAANVSTEKRSKNCAQETEKNFMEIMAAAYTTNHGTQFGTLKNMVKKMTNEVRQGLKENIQALTWFDAATKRKVNEKVDAIESKIGFPDYLSTPAKVAHRLQKYDTLVLNEGEYFRNRIAVSKWEQKQKLNKFGHPVNDNDMWPVYAHEGTGGVTYVYDNNWLVQPLAALQPPHFYRNDALRALNFGDLGTDLGSTFLQSFDNNGQKFDKHGRPIRGQMFTNITRRQIHTREQCFARQYSQYRLFGRLQVDGAAYSSFFVIKDEGFKAASKAYYNWAKKKSSVTHTLPNLRLTNEQLFYVAFGQTRCHGGTTDGLTKAFKKERWDARFSGCLALSDFLVLE